jgi:hypothetical protein
MASFSGYVERDPDYIGKILGTWATGRSQGNLYARAYSISRSVPKERLSEALWVAPPSHRILRITAANVQAAPPFAVFEGWEPRAPA